MHTKKLLALLAALFLTQAAIEPGELVTITSAADSTNQAAWWAPLDQYGGYDWFAYLRNPPGGSTSKNNVMVARRSISDGAIYRDCVKMPSGECAVFADDAGHNTPSIAVDGDGFVHVFTSMHNEQWKYFRSSAAYSSTLVDRSSEMPDQTAIFTYPMVKRGNNGDLWLIIRGQASGDSSAKGGYFN